MPRERDPKRKQAEKLWIDSGGQLDLVDIAAQLGISPGTVRGWKSKDKWSEKLNGTFQSSKKRNAPKQERSKPKAERNTGPPEVVIENNALTEKQRIFVMEYMRDFNATRAAIVVGYSKKTAYSIGWELLRKPEIQAEIKRQKEMRAAELGLDVQRIIAEYMKIAFADVTDLLDFGQREVQVMNVEGNPIMKTVNYVDFKDAAEVDGTVISEVKQGKEGVSIKLHDKMRALEKLEKYVGFMSEEDRLRLDKLRAEVQAMKKPDDDDDQQDDGFMDALRGAAAEVWDNGPTEA